MCFYCLSGDIVKSTSSLIQVVMLSFSIQCIVTKVKTSIRGPDFYGKCMRCTPSCPLFQVVAECDLE